MNQRSFSQNTDDVDIVALWRAVKAKKAWLAGVTISAGLITLVALQFMTPLYSSQTRILIEYDEPTFMRPRSESGNSSRQSVRLDPEAVASQVQVLLSRDIAHQVVKKLKLENNPEFNAPSGPLAGLKKILVAVGFSSAPTVSAREDRALDVFERRLTVYQVSKSRVIEVSFESEDPSVAAKAANTLADIYLTWQQAEKLQQTKNASQWLNSQIGTLRKQVENSESKVEEFRSSAGLISGSNNITLDAQQLSELNSQLILAKAQRTEAVARANLIRRMLKEKGDVASAPDVLRSALIQRLLEQNVRVRRQLAELSATLLPSHPRIRQLTAELSDMRRQIRQEAQKVVGSLENEAQIAGARETSLRSSLEELKKDSSTSREFQIKLRSLEREAKANRDLLESYLARYREASARNDESSVPAHASIISRAHAASEPSFPKKGPISILVAAAAGLLSLSWVLARELVTGSYANFSWPPTQPRHEGQRAAFGSNEKPVRPGPAPAAVQGKRQRRVRSAASAAKLVASECTGATAHNLVVTSDNHRADTAQDSLELGRALAATGLRVAVVDFSGSGNGVAGLAGLSNIPGLGELLGGSAKFENVISSDPEGTAQIIPSGMLQSDVLAGNNALQWQRVHNALKQIYDCIVVHCSISGARRLLHSMPDHPTTLLLVTGESADAELAEQVVEYLVRDRAAPINVLTYNGARTAGDPARVGAFGQAAAVG
ncbi:MAG: exopolysaccharide transport family protein [Hyphomicrobiales bacterium]|nr:exopolysaccharide transport family protein [Hyphomicrobiales bacterium]